MTQGRHQRRGRRRDTGGKVWQSSAESMNGRPPLPKGRDLSALAHRFPDMRRYPSFQRLSPREREIALLVGDGLELALIARRLNLAPATVSNHLQRIRWRLRLAQRADIAPWVAARRVPDRPD